MLNTFNFYSALITSATEVVFEVGWVLAGCTCTEAGNKKIADYAQQLILFLL